MTFQKGHPQYNSGRTRFVKKDKRITGLNHHFWKGDKASYSALHHWILREKGKPTVCQECGFESDKSKLVQWANISGDYKRDLNDYKALCAKCHFEFDKQYNRKRDSHGRFL